MSANEMVSGIGLRHVRVALRDTDGTIDVPAGTAVATAYNGLQISGAIGLVLTVPDAVRIPVPGDDRVFYTWLLPPTENKSAELRVNKKDHNVIALITGTLQWGSPNRRKIAFNTDKQGEEPELVLWASRQVIEADETLATFGTKKWETYYIPNCLAYPRPPGMEYQTIGTMTYSVQLNDAAITELGQSLTLVTNGCTKAELFEIVTDKKFMLDAWMGDNIVATFNMSQTPYEAGVFNVTIDGVVQDLTTDYTRVAGALTFVVTPASGAKIICEYEYE